MKLVNASHVLNSVVMTGTAFYSKIKIANLALRTIALATVEEAARINLFQSWERCQSFRTVN